MVAGEAADGRRPRVLVTRPSADAIPLAAELQRRGFDVMLQPLLRIDYEDGPPVDLSGVQALLFTSANGVRAFARRSDVRTVPVYAVGDATAAEATAARFLSVASAGGNVDDLAALVRDRLDPAGGKLLHVAGSVVAGDLAGALARAGFEVERLPLYTAHRTEALDPSIHSAIAADAVDAALFFSPRSAASFGNLVRDAALEANCRHIQAFGLSDAVSRALSPVSWRAVHIAPEPTQESMLAILEREVTDTDQADASQGKENSSANASDLLAQGDAAGVVERFGGIRPMAAKLGIPVTTVQGWRGRGHIPDNRIDEIRSAAAEHGVDLSPGSEQAASGTEAGAPAAAEKTEPVLSDSASESESQADTKNESMEEDIPPAAPAAPRQSSSGVAWAALILAVVALAAVASYRYWGGFGAESPQISDALLARIDKLEKAVAADTGASARVDQVAGKLDSLERQVAALPKGEAGDGKAIAAVTDEIASLRSALDGVEGKATRAATEAADRSAAAAKEELDKGLAAMRSEIASLREGLGGIETRVKAIEDRPPATGEKIAALAVAAGQLESAVDSGQPFESALASMKSLAAGDAEIEQSLAALSPGAAAGVPTTLSLTREFNGIAPKLMVPAPATDTGGWTDTLRKKAMSLVNMRPVGTSGDQSPVTRAERALAANDLAGAVAALDGISGPAVAWREEAQKRLDADAAIADIRARIVKRLASSSQQPAAAAGDAAATPREKP